MNFKKSIPLWVRVKSFFGIFALTPFEEELIEGLRKALSGELRDILDSQLRALNTVNRLIEADDDPNSYGYTEFHCVKLGKVILEYGQPFAVEEKEKKFAETFVRFVDGEINVEFWLVRGRLFSMEYRSSQKIYYPPEEHETEPIVVLLKQEMRSQTSSEQ